MTILKEVTAGLMVRISIGLLAVPIFVGGTSAQELGTSTGLALEEMQSGFVVSPVVKLADVDGDIGTLAGLYGGWMTDGRLLIGAGAYWLTSGADDVDMAYGGGVVEWFSNPGAWVSASIGSLVGVGSATLDTVVNFDGGSGRSGRFSRGRFGSFGRHALPASATVRFREEFFIAEPQASLVLNAADWFRLGLGAGYRLVGGAREFDERLRGFTATFGIQLGP